MIDFKDPTSNFCFEENANLAEKRHFDQKVAFRGARKVNRLISIFQISNFKFQLQFSFEQIKITLKLFSSVGRFD